ncbi:MAG: HlyD family secretion protein [Sneathiella sp.]|uniref:HlyD family secretion protein n=1 Tax=Sneathiella sp. TaxID=1964365 RepID=UPI00300221A8
MPFIIGLAGLYYSSGYFFVYNNDAYVDADVVRVSAGVPGIVNDVAVADNDFVNDGTLLLSLDQEPFILAVKSAKAQLKKVKVEQVNLTTETAELLAELNISKAKNKLATVELARYKKLFQSGTTSQQNFQEREEQQKITQLEVVQAQKAYELSMQQADIFTAEIENLESAVGLSEYQLGISKIYAPGNGYINNLRLYSGDYANLGEALFGFVKENTTRVVANIKDTNLAMLHPGKPVWVYLSSYPWQLFKGEVESLGRGVSRTISTSDPALPYVKPVTSWIRYSYRIPVRINLIDIPEGDTLQVGIDARVIILR